MLPWPREAFALAPGIAHLAAGGEPPWLLRHERAIRRFADDKSQGYAGRPRQMRELDRVRAMLAAAWGVAVEDVGFAASVAEGVGLLAESLDLAGGSVLAWMGEYPSLLGPFAARPGLALRLAPSLAELPGMVDATTRVLLVSDVSQLTGEAADLPALRAAADRVGALLVVDYTQSAGWKRIQAGIADFAFSACYKWLLGTTGIAVAMWNRARQPGWRPRSFGWFNIATPTDWRAPAPVPGAMRFSRGNPAFLPLYLLGEALDFAASTDPAALEAHVLALTARLRRGVLAAGLLPSTPAAHGANLCLPHPDPDAVVARLAAGGVLAWGGRGRIRFSFHGYNTEAEADRALALLTAPGILG